LAHALGKPGGRAAASVGGARRLGRRRALSLIAAAAGLPLLAGRESRAAAPAVRWHGTALGADASLTICHPDRALARRLIGLALREIERLEAVFSLYRSDSALGILNRDGALDRPPQDLVALLGAAKRWGDWTHGAFDVTVQPLWRLYAAHFTRRNADPAGPPPDQVERARDLIDYRAIRLDTGRIALTRPGMAVTLNGIAQGYITDRVTELLRAEGLSQVLVNLGEVRALGAGQDGQGWRVGIADPLRPGRLAGTVEIQDRAVATSSARGTVFDRAGTAGHILHPDTGADGSGFLSASVVAARAQDADALSTALVADTRVAKILSGSTAMGIERVLVLDRDSVLYRLAVA
jgi:thiamine biosynthesis lipoprotein